MSIKEILKDYFGIVCGIIVAVVIILLGYLKVIDILEGAFLFFTSVPFILWVKTLSFFNITNDLISGGLFVLILVTYSGLLGQNIFLFKTKPNKVLAFNLFFLIVINIYAYFYSLDILDSIEKSIKIILH